MNWKKLSAFATDAGGYCTGRMHGKNISGIYAGQLTKPKQKKSHSRKKQHKAQKKKDRKRPK